MASVVKCLLQRVQLLEQKAECGELGRIGQMKRAELLEQGDDCCSLGFDVSGVRCGEVGAVFLEFGEFGGDGGGQVLVDVFNDVLVMCAVGKFITRFIDEVSDVVCIDCLWYGENVRFQSVETSLNSTDVVEGHAVGWVVLYRLCVCGVCWREDGKAREAGTA
jgi:hypothetical protein